MWLGTGRTKEVVEQLIARGCKAGRTDLQGNTPWHAAAESGNLAAVALFMSNGCQPDARNHVGWTALHFAARSGASGQNRICDDACRAA